MEVKMHEHLQKMFFMIQENQDKITKLGNSKTKKI